MKMYCKKDNWILGAFYSKYVKQKLKKKKKYVKQIKK